MGHSLLFDDVLLLELHHLGLQFDLLEFLLLLLFLDHEFNLEQFGLMSTLKFLLSQLVGKLILTDILTVFCLFFGNLEFDILNVELSLLLFNGKLLLSLQNLLLGFTLLFQLIEFRRSLKRFRFNLVFSVSRNLFGFHSTFLSELSLKVGK